MVCLTSSVRNKFDHVYQSVLGKTKRAIRTGKLRVARGISHDRMLRGTHSSTIAKYVRESRAHYMYHYTKSTTGVVLVSQDW